MFLVVEDDEVGKLETKEINTHDSPLTTRSKFSQDRENTLQAVT